MNSKRSTNTVQENLLKVTRGLRIPMKEFDFTFSRSSGPGGQNVNKVSTKAQLRWNVAGSHSMNDTINQRLFKLHRRRITSDGDLIVSSQRYRDQSRNVADCLEKLRQILLQAAETPKRRKKTKRPKSAVEQRLKEKRQQAEKKRRRRQPRLQD